MKAVSVVVACSNPDTSILGTIASVRRQTHRDLELIVVDDGTDKPDCRPILEQAFRLADRFVEQRRSGLSAARNSGFRATGAEFVIPVNAGDRLRPAYIEQCIRALAACSRAAFAYTGIEIPGKSRRIDPGAEYNLYDLLESNHITCTALLRRSDWEQAGGYDESMRCGCEDWEFWLRLGARGRYGVLVPQVLFEHREAEGAANGTDRDAVEYIRRKHAGLYKYESRMRLKAEWRPAVSILGAHRRQTIGDTQSVEEAAALRESKAAAFLVAGAGGAPPEAAEMAALAVWGGHKTLRLPDGSLALSPRAWRAAWPPDRRVRAAQGARPPRRPAWPGGGRLRQHLANAEVDSWQAWLEHPIRSATRLIPLAVKQRINELAGRPLFDLAFYLRFQPASVLIGRAIVQPLRYLPPPPTRRRVALITPHLGPGGAEQVLMEIAASLDPQAYELFLLATHSRDDRWAERWRSTVDHVYDLAALVSSRCISAAVDSIVTNWNCETVLVQNSLFGYAALPMIQGGAAGTRILALVHAVGNWNELDATAAVNDAVDARIAVSELVRDELLRAGIAKQQIRVIRNGVDLERFRPAPQLARAAVRKILFAGRLDPVKRPLMLVDIAQHLAELRSARDFRLVVAGDGPELPKLRTKVRRKRAQDLVECLGFIDDMAALFRQSDILILPSCEEGIPLAILEAMASGVPVLASRVGAIAEAVDPACGILIEPGEGEARRFAAGLHRLLNDDALRTAMGRAARQKAAAQFDLERTRALYRRLFENAAPAAPEAMSAEPTPVSEDA